MKPFEKLRRLFGRGKPEPLPEPEQPIDDRPDWMKKIDAINARCEDRKRLNRMTQGGRLITEAPYEKRSRENGDRPN